jgi:hypothetical protein
MLPKTIYVSDVPSTYTDERRKPFIRDPLPWDPMKETVTGMRGYMHGVKLTRTPPMYEERRARSMDPRRYVSRPLVRFSNMGALFVTCQKLYFQK